ncbi:MAG: starch-binding protein [Muribaculum sp.]|nr:starch-binding protein [Muribaculum sp.]
MKKLLLLAIVGILLPLCANAGDISVYFQLPAGWNASSLHCYYFNKGGNGNNEWPGTVWKSGNSIVSNGVTYYRFSIPDWATTVIFNQGSSGSKTDDLKVLPNGCYDNSMTKETVPFYFIDNGDKYQYVALLGNNGIWEVSVGKLFSTKDGVTYTYSTNSFSGDFKIWVADNWYSISPQTELAPNTDYKLDNNKENPNMKLKEGTMTDVVFTFNLDTKTLSYKQTQYEDINVYFDNSSAQWSNVYCYAYNGDEDKNAEWPGVQVTEKTGNLYKATYSSRYQHVIFNNNNGAQTADLDTYFNGVYTKDSQANTDPKLTYNGSKYAYVRAPYAVKVAGESIPEDFTVEAVTVRPEGSTYWQSDDSYAAFNLGFVQANNSGLTFDQDSPSLFKVTLTPEFENYPNAVNFSYLPSSKLKMNGSALEAQVHVVYAGEYIMEVSYTEDENYEPYVLTFPVKVLPTVASLGITLNGNPVARNNGSVSNYGPYYKGTLPAGYNSIEEYNMKNARLLLTPVALGNFDLNNYSTVWYMLVDKENTLPTRATSDVITVTNPEEEGYTKYDPAHPTMDLTNRTLRLVMSQNGVMNPTVYATTPLYDSKITTAVEAIAIEENQETIYYNLQGVRVENPEHGIYVKVADGRASKVIL